MGVLEVIDLRTILLLLPFTALLMVLILWLGRASDRGHGLGRWTTGLTLIAGGWILMATRGYLPPALSVALADTCITLGLLLQVGGIYEFRHRKPPSPSILLPAPILLAALLLLPLEYPEYSLLASLFISAPLFVMGVQSWTLSDTLARFPMSICYVVGSVLVLARGLHIWFSPEAVLHFFARHPLHIATFLESFAMTICGSFGFLELQRRRAERNIRHLAMYDELTQLLNRRAFFELAERERLKAKRSGLTMATMMLDVDHFKSINDRHGHFTGDRVLSEIGLRMGESMRPNDLLGRAGGEEFVALLVDVSRDQAVAGAQRIRADVEQQVTLDDETSVTISIGLAFCEGWGENTVDESLRRADEALYEAKRRGRNCVVVAQSATSTRSPQCPSGEPSTGHSVN